MFKVSVHNEEEMKKFTSGNNPIAKPIFDECIEIVEMYELSKVNLRINKNGRKEERWPNFI